jgi:hypothetical protein
MSKTEYVKKVIMSCQNIKQLETCELWIKNIDFTEYKTLTQGLIAFGMVLDLKRLINQMKEYIEKRDSNVRII